MESSTPYESISIHDINPHIGLVQLSTLSDDAFEQSWLPYEYRLNYFLTSTGFLEIADKRYALKKHTLTLIGPGTEYNWIRGKSPTQYYTVRFDFTQNHKELYPRLEVGRHDSYDESKIIEQVRFSDFPPFNSAVYMNDMSFMEVYFHKIHSAYSNAGIMGRDIARSILQTLLFELAQTITTGSIVYSKKGGLFEEISAYIHGNYPRIDIPGKKLAEQFGTSLQSANKEFLANANMTMYQYLTAYRVQEALHILKTTQLPLSEVARMTGFKTQNYFSRYIKKISGFTPGEYRILTRKKKK